MSNYSLSKQIKLPTTIGINKLSSGIVPNMGSCLPATASVNEVITPIRMREVNDSDARSGGLDEFVLMTNEGK